MAHITQETKKNILDKIKRIIKKHDSNIKVSASIHNYSKLIIRLKSINLQEEDNKYHELRKSDDLPWEMKNMQVLFFPNSINLSTIQLYKKIEKTIHEIGGYYDNSDVMADYFDYAFYYACKIA